MITDIVSIIDSSLNGVGGNFFGLAETVYRKKESLPGVVDFNGDIKYVGLDNTEALQAYHKLNSAQTVQLKNGRGDSVGDLQTIFQMSLFVSWNKIKLRKHKDEILFLLHARFPAEVKNLPNVKSAFIRLGQANLISATIFQQEYQGIEVKIPEYMQLMQLNYAIELIINPDCLIACP